MATPACAERLRRQADLLARGDARARGVRALRGQRRPQRLAVPERLADALAQLDRDGLRLAGAHAEALRAVLVRAAEQPQLAAGDGALVALATDAHLHAALAVHPQLAPGLDLRERP